VERIGRLAVISLPRAVITARRFRRKLKPVFACCTTTNHTNSSHNTTHCSQMRSPTNEKCSSCSPYASTGQSRPLSKSRKYDFLSSEEQRKVCCASKNYYIAAKLFVEKGSVNPINTQQSVYDRGRSRTPVVGEPQDVPQDPVIKPGSGIHPLNSLLRRLFNVSLSIPSLLRPRPWSKELVRSCQTHSASRTVTLKPMTHGR